MENIETWREIPGFEGYYEVSNIGNVRSLTRKLNDKRGFRTQTGKNKKLIQQRSGYLTVGLYKNHFGRHYLVHRLVAMAFIPNDANKPFINHIDCNKANNHVSNLEWCTNKENIIHASINGKMAHGESHYNAKLKDGAREAIKMLVSNGMSQYKVAKIFSINQSHISRIVNNKERRR